MADLTKLHQWFTPTEARRYFGARTQAEIDYAARFIGNMPPYHREAFKRTLFGLSIQRASEKRYANR